LLVAAPTIASLAFCLSPGQLSSQPYRDDVLDNREKPFKVHLLNRKTPWLEKTFPESEVSPQAQEEPGFLLSKQVAAPVSHQTNTSTYHYPWRKD
jgi:hypothetical protein